MSIIWLFVTAALLVLFVVLGAVMVKTALDARRGTLSFRSAVGINHPNVIRDEQAWVKAHRAVWTLFALSGAVAFFHALAIIPASFVTEIHPGTYLLVISSAGLVVIVALRVLMTKAALAALSSRN